MPEAPKIQIPPYYGHTAVVPTVPALEGLHCIAPKISLQIDSGQLCQHQGMDLVRPNCKTALYFSLI